jgi:hypothetical protein
MCYSEYTSVFRVIERKQIHHNLLNWYPLLYLEIHFIFVDSSLLNWGLQCIVVKALRHKPVGCGFDSGWCHWNFSVT